MTVEKRNLCECGCGQLVSQRFARGHCHRVVERKPTPCKCGCGELVIGAYAKGHYDRVRQYPQKEPQLCACGCGEYAPVTQGKVKKFITGHHHRVRSEETKKKFSEVRKGRKLSDEHKEKLRQNLLDQNRKGENHPLYGKHHSDEARQKMSVSRKGKPNGCGPRVSESNRRLWQDPVMRSRWSESRKKMWKNPSFIAKVLKSLKIHPNTKETLLLEILDAISPNEWKFVGDFSLVIGGKSPDFINTKNPQLLVELFGDYWHRGEDPQERIDFFAQYGYSTLVIWEKELSDIPILAEKIIDFIAS